MKSDVAANRRDAPSSDRFAATFSPSRGRRISTYAFFHAACHTFARVSKPSFS